MAWRNKLPAVSISHNNFNMVPKRAIRQWFVMRVRVLYWLLFKGSKAILSRITGKTKIIERKVTLETFNLRTNLQKSIWVRSYTVLFYTSFTAIKVLKIISYLLEDNIPLEFFYLCSFLEEIFQRVNTMPRISSVYLRRKLKRCFGPQEMN